MKMEPTVNSETSAIRTQTPGNYPKRTNYIRYMVYYANHTIQYFISLKKYVTERNKLLLYFELCEQAVSFIMHGEAYNVEVMC